MIVILKPGKPANTLGSYRPINFFPLHRRFLSVGSVLDPTLFLLYTMDIPQAPDITTCLFTDDTCIVANDFNYDVAVTSLQSAVTNVSKWGQIWKIELNEAKSVRVDFALRPMDTLQRY
ncbi:hypothetical protein PGB90_007180 [Kerria lacca]